MDLFTKKIIGWSMDSTLKSSLVNDAMKMAVRSCKPASGLLFHSDRGSQYCSKSYRNLLENNGISQSMSRRGNCWDKAPSESFFSTMKREIEGFKNLQNHAEARLKIFDYIEVFYNRQRLHSSLGYLSPDEFEKKTNPC